MRGHSRVHLNKSTTFHGRAHQQLHRAASYPSFLDLAITMSSSTPSSKVTSSSSGGRSTKQPPKATKVIRLKLSPALLAPFSHKEPARKPSHPKSSSSSTSTPVHQTTSTPSTEVKSEANSTPAPAGSDPLQPPADGITRKGLLGPKVGVKREVGQGDDVSKPRGKPGPKKKPRL